MTAQAAPGRVRVTKLHNEHREAFEKFLSELDRRTTYDYTHFGYKIASPAAAASGVFKEVAAGKVVGYILLDKERIVGFGHLDLFPEKEKRHVVKLGIVLHQRYQGKGIGKKLLDAMTIDAAEMGIEKIWLATYADNRRARELYRSRGFIVEGVFRKEEKVRCRYRDIVSMALFLGKGK